MGGGGGGKVGGFRRGLLRLRNSAKELCLATKPKIPISRSKNKAKKLHLFIVNFQFE